MTKVLITAAGTGSRVGSALNKGLISVGDKPVLSHIVEKFNVPIVVALGYGGSLVEEYLRLTYPGKRFEFVYVNPFDGEGASPAHSILSCEYLLNCPFIFITNDTIVDEIPPPPDEDWIGLSQKRDFISQYRTFNGSLQEKSESPPNGSYPYIGLAGIHDYESFWRGMKGGEVAQGEANGLRSLSLKPVFFSWHDTGNRGALEQAKSEVSPTHHVIPKHSEAIWFTNGKVIKYHADPDFINKRVWRMRDLAGFVPELLGRGNNMYSYKYVEGVPLTNIVTVPLFIQFLKYVSQLWKKKCSERVTAKKVQEFYIEKARSRTESFLNLHHLDNVTMINGKSCRPALDLLEIVERRGLPFHKDWAGVIHGDLHLDNVLWDEKTQQFNLVDWRQGFGGLLNKFDIHYDLAKLYQSCILSYETVLKKKFSITVSDRLDFWFSTDKVLLECQDILRVYCEQQDFDWDRVKLITSLIFLSNAPLQTDDDYAILNYCLGRYMLEDLV